VKILFTQWGLPEKVDGSTQFVVEVTTELARRGHDIAVYAGEIGSIGRGLEQRTGILVIDDPRGCPWKPDVIHGQHRIHVLKALMAFPSTPGLLYIHGFLPLLEKPFLHPRLLRYVGVAPGIANYWSDAIGIESDRFEVILNHIDLQRFRSIREIPEKPRKALLYANRSPSAEHLQELRNACDAEGISLDLAGSCCGSQEQNPESILPRYDLVFAVGRSALEALACGCAVIPIYSGMAEEFVLPGNYDRIRNQNMAVCLNPHEKLTAGWIKSQIARWDPEAIGEVARRVRESTRLERTVDRLESLYAEMIAEAGSKPLPDMEADIESIHLFWQKDHSYRSSVRRRATEMRIRSMEKSWSWRVTTPLRWMQKSLHACLDKR